MLKKFQIVRVDDDVVQREDLHVGQNIISRPLAPEANEGQVIKHAVTINVEDNGEMTIIPYQVSPCYIKCIQSSRWELLKLGEAVPIHPGDVCSLLPSKSWFKVVEMSEMVNENPGDYKRKAEDDLDDTPPDKRSCSQSSVEAVISPSEHSNDIASSDNVDSNLGEESQIKDIYSASSQGEAATQSSSSNMQEVSPNSESESNETKKDRPTRNGDASKRIKWDCGQHFSDQSDQGSAGTASEPTQNRQAEVASVHTTKRDRCSYGGKCYRKQPDHKKKYSHPGDPDYSEPDNRPECRYGMRCYRKNPEHRNAYKHTSRGLRRAQTPIRAKKDDDNVIEGFDDDGSSAEESVDESEYNPNSSAESSDEYDDDDVIDISDGDDNDDDENDDDN